MRPIDQLRLYKIRVEELRQCKLFKAGFSPSFQMSFDRDSGLKWTLNDPDEDDLRSFLLTFRQFVLQREPVFVYKVFSLCQQYITDEFLKKNLREAREDWKKMQTNQGIRLILRGQELRPEYIIDLWINGFYFHNDEEKRTMLEQLLPHQKDFIRGQFLIYLVDATNVVLYVAAVIRWAEEGNHIDPAAYE